MDDFVLFLGTEIYKRTTKLSATFKNDKKYEKFINVFEFFDFQGLNQVEAPDAVPEKRLRII